MGQKLFDTVMSVHLILLVFTQVMIDQLQGVVSIILLKSIT